MGRRAARCAAGDRVSEPDDFDAAPYVCPGCYAVGGERCAPGCIDAEIEAEHREAIESGNYERFDENDLNDSNDWEWEP